MRLLQVPVLLPINKGMPGNITGKVSLLIYEVISSSITISPLK